MTDEFAINILEQYRENPTLINEIKTVEEAVWLDEALDMAIKALKQTRWIPVKELPKEQITIGKHVFSENVLGTEGYTIRRAYYNYTTKEWFDGNEEMEWTEITHWMPLPEETPKVESEDKE